MKIKRFFAPDMRRAIQQVRSEHGSDAFILSSSSVEGGVELISAVDYDEVLISQLVGAGLAPREAAGEVAADAADDDSEDNTHDAEHDHPAPTASPESAPAGARPARSRTVIEWTQDPALKRLQGELDTLKNMLREQFSQLQWADLNTFDPDRALLLRQVSSMGLAASLAEKICADVRDLRNPSAAWREVIMGLGRRLSVVSEDPIERGGVFALVGPTGVGKTTTIAKLAARHCLRYGSDSLGLVTTDSFRVGAQRQLDAYGAILGVPVHRADTAAELRRRLDELSAKKVVLVDTAGLAPRDCRLAAAMAQLDACPPLQRYLVLAANMQYRVMREAVAAFERGGLAGVALTKTDEVTSLGPALSALIESKLRTAWLSGGQRVPEDLCVAKPVHLLRWAMHWEAPAADEQSLVPAVRAAHSREVAGV